MGLGKTLQTLCILASAAHDQRQLDTLQPGSPALPSLVICPPTLTAHWVAEARKFCEGQLRPLEYVGSAAQRERLWQTVCAHDLVVASYDVVRVDAQRFRGHRWDYCVLDEGHVIKNGRSRTTLAVKALAARRRLLLSGTPLQNNALELWSLFDFLMPGYLGSQAQFNQRYSRPIQASMGARAGDAQQLAGEEALRKLHRQVLPFILRRTKEQVLAELPPKIIEDHICELHPLQRRLYDAAFAESRARQGIARALDDVSRDGEAGDEVEPPRGAKHVFTALQYLRKLCNHPLLVLDAHHPLRAECEAAAADAGGLHALELSPKLLTLQQLLLDAGIGAETATSSAVGMDDHAGGTPLAAHRALIFCQSREMLDLVATDLLDAAMPSVSYLRLDGSVPAARRFELVTRFNNDPSLDLMLLTTSVGGLGLNLASADVVIFVDHDWNPMKDLQAMDRAHRIGQTRSVNIYRLIMRDTLEEKIMGLQKFKLHIANSVVNQQNAQLATMNTEQLLDLFDVSPATGSIAASSAPDARGMGVAAAEIVSTGRKPKGLQAVLDEVGELWGNEQYEEEYNLQGFLATL